MPSSTRADAGPDFVYRSGVLQPDKRTQVEMLGEIVRFSNFVGSHPKEKRFENQGASFHVRAEFKLQNTGDEDEKVGMFFPFCVDYLSNENPTRSACRVNSIDVRLDDKTIKYKLRKMNRGRWDKPMIDIVFEAEFPKDRVRTLVVTYVIGETDGSDFKDSIPPFAGFDYILHSGSGWRGKIRTGKVIVETPYAVTEQNVMVSRHGGVPAYGGAHKQIGKEFELIRRENSLIFSFENLEPKRKHDFSVWIQQPSFLKDIKALEDRLKKNPDDRKQRLKLVKSYHFLFNSKRLFAETMRPLIVKRYPKAKEKRTKRLVDAYWNFLFYDSETFIENRYEQWPKKVCNSVDELFYVVAQDKNEQERLCNNIRYSCQHLNSDIPPKCNEYEYNPE